VALNDARYVALTSFRRTGAGVSTPFGALHRQGKIYCFTDARSGKVKRIRRDPRVEVAPCTRSGASTGPTVSGRARVLDGSEAQEMATAFNELWTRQFGLTWRIGSLVERLRRIERVVIEIEPTTDGSVRAGST
jgi:PPOX class probable F420-dependent enzyme